MPFIRSISGLRATVGDSLSPALVARYVAAFIEFTGKGPVVIGRDGRPSGGWIEDLVVGALRGCGAEARVIGVAPTPTVQLATERSDAVGGISITFRDLPSMSIMLLSACSFVSDGRLIATNCSSRIEEICIEEVRSKVNDSGRQTYENMDVENA